MNPRLPFPRDRAFVVTYWNLTRETTHRLTVQADDLPDAWNQAKYTFGMLDPVISVKPLSEVSQ